MGLIQKYAQRLLEKKLAGTKREIKLSGFSNAAKVGVLWHIDEMDAFLYISDFLREKKIPFRNLCYTGSNKERFSNSFCRKETNFWGFPKSGIASAFMEVEYDLLMNISVTGCFELDAVTVLAKSHFKVGWADRFKNLYDLSIDVSKNKDSLFLVKQQIHYLEQFNKAKQGWVYYLQEPGLP
jgi:hypothetical protein